METALPRPWVLLTYITSRCNSVPWVLLTYITSRCNSVPWVLLTVSSLSAVVTTTVSTTGPPSQDLPSVHQQIYHNAFGAVVAQLVREQTAMVAKQQAMETTLAATQRELEETKTELEATKTKLAVAETKLEIAETKIEATETSLNATKTRLETNGANLETTMSKLQNTTSELQTFRADVRLGSSFVRWGRKTCPNNTVHVYEGVAGGKMYYQKGSGTNHLCLTRTPQFDDTPKPSLYGLLYGAEYDHIPFHHQHDVPCSLCLAPQSTTIMVPATLSCPPGWTPQYSGHLASQRDGIQASEYVCLDGRPEDGPNAARDDNGLLFHWVVTVCGSLPCPPYINDRVVTCVVCSK